jgi:hypothetical protein
VPARTGSFGTSLNPFGTGTFGGLTQYNVGDNLKDLQAYRDEVAWGNGTISDEQYRASLQQLAAAADPGSQAQISAQNKLEDVTYRIGRSQADAGGLDSLIAFDQQALSGMNSGNLRYRDVKSSLNSELASRRSRDYGKLTDAYNAGVTSTESLLAWVQSTISSLPADAPDKDNWDSVQSSLASRIVDEKDAQMYQDYQDRKVKPEDFVAYLTGRRDAVDPSSPQWDKANQRLLDAEKNIKDVAQSKQDQADADAYSNGKISDAEYLLRLNKRVSGMAADDPDLPAWQQRLSKAAHSLAEDKLKYDVNIANAAGVAASNKAHKALPMSAAEKTARSSLLKFYQAYAVTLNPGSAEWRAMNESIVSLKGSLVDYGTAAAAGGKSSGKAKVGGGTVTPFVPDKDLPKHIDPKTDLSTVIKLLTPNALAPKKEQTVIVDALRLNLARATDGKNDKVWLFQDPRSLGDVVAARNPDGTPVLDKRGKPVMVRGTAYLPASSDAIAQMKLATATYSYQLADVAAGKGDRAGYLTALWHGQEAENAARDVQATAVRANVATQLDTLQKGIDVFTRLNDPATAYNLLLQQVQIVRSALDDGSLDQTQRDTLQKRLDKIEANPLAPKWLEDMNGEGVKNAAGLNTQIGGALNLASSPHDPNDPSALVPGTGVYAPDVHFELDTSTAGDPAWKPVRYPGAPGTYEMSHIQVQTGTLGVPVSGWVAVQKSAGITHGLYFTDQSGAKQYANISLPTSYITYVDGYGNRVNGYSIDGNTWVMATGGVLPDLEINTKLTKVTNADGTISYMAEDGTTEVLKSNADGSAWTTAAGMDAVAGQGLVGWYGQAAAEAGGSVSEGVGSKGSQFRLVQPAIGADGTSSLNLVPNEVIFAQSGRAFQITEVRSAKEGRAPSFSIAKGTPNVSERTGFVIPPKPGEAATSPKVNAFTGFDLNAPSKTTPNVNSATGFVIPPKAFDAGAFVSSLVRQAAPAVQGIIHVGATLLPALIPPSTLPPVYVPFLGTVAMPALRPVVTAPPAYRPPLVQPAPTPVRPPVVVHTAAEGRAPSYATPPPPPPPTPAPKKSNTTRTAV